jgi:hypothetical protein
MTMRFERISADVQMEYVPIVDAAGAEVTTA